MGGGIARRLAEKESVVVFDMDSARVGAVTDADGVTAVSQARAWSEHIIVSLIPTSESLLAAIVEAIAKGSLREDAVIIDMSTANPQLTDVIARMLQLHGVRYVAAPVMSGGPDEARSGTLRLAVGTSGTLRAHERSVLERAGEIIIEASTPRAVQLLKLSNNMIALVTSAVLAEAWAIATQELDAEEALRALSAGTAARWVNMDRMALANAVETDETAGFSAALAAKDLRAFSAWASTSGVSAAIAAAASTIYAAAIGAGKGAGEAGAWPWLMLRRMHASHTPQGKS